MVNEIMELGRADMGGERRRIRRNLEERILRAGNRQCSTIR